MDRKVKKIDKIKNEEEALNAAKGILNDPPKKTTRGILNQIRDEDKPTHSSSPPITQEDFENIIFSQKIISTDGDFYMSVRGVGSFKRDINGNWFALTNEDWALPDSEIYRPCLSPFLDDTYTKTRSEIIFINLK